MIRACDASLELATEIYRDLKDKVEPLLGELNRCATLLDTEIILSKAIEEQYTRKIDRVEGLLRQCHLKFEEDDASDGFEEEESYRVIQASAQALICFATVEYIAGGLWFDTGLKWAGVRFENQNITRIIQHRSHEFRRPKKMISCLQQSLKPPPSASWPCSNTQSCQDHSHSGSNLVWPKDACEQRNALSAVAPPELTFRTFKYDVILGQMDRNNAFQLILHATNNSLRAKGKIPIRQKSFTQEQTAGLSLSLVSFRYHWSLAMIAKVGNRFQEALDEMSFPQFRLGIILDGDSEVFYPPTSRKGASQIDAVFIKATVHKRSDPYGILPLFRLRFHGVKTKIVTPPEMPGDRVPFLNLPAEMRLLIYNRAVDSDPQNSRRSVIRLTCKQINEEFSEVLRERRGQ